MKDDLNAGARAFLQLLADVNSQTTADFEAASESQLESGEDVRDYAAIVDSLETTLRVNFVEASADRRQGFMRALADLLACHVEGGWRPMPYDPVQITEASFRARAAVARARQ